MHFWQKPLTNKISQNPEYPLKTQLSLKMICAVLIGERDIFVITYLLLMKKSLTKEEFKEHLFIADESIVATLFLFSDIL